MLVLNLGQPKSDRQRAQKITFKNNQCYTLAEPDWLGRRTLPCPFWSSGYMMLEIYLDYSSKCFSEHNLDITDWHIYITGDLKRRL